MNNFFDLLSIFLTTILITQIYHNHGTTAQSTSLYHICYGENYTSNSLYHSNLVNLLLPSLSSSHENTSLSSSDQNYTYRYRSVTVGRYPNTIFGDFQCRGDISLESCKVCVDNAARDILQSSMCLNSKQAIICYDECMLRYSNLPFFSTLELNPAVFDVVSFNNISNPDQFFPVLTKLLNDLSTKAIVSNGFSKNFATGERDFMHHLKVYGLVQCNSDISMSDCKICLRKSIENLPRCCYGKQGGRVIYPSCYFRYEMYHFYESNMTMMTTPNVVPPLALSRPEPPLSKTITRKTGKILSKVVIMVVVVMSIIVLIIVNIWFFFLTRRRKNLRTFTDVEEIQTGDSIQFNFSTIRAATNNFSDANKLGEGGFGYVYKGTLSNGQEIAVKRLSKNSGQGEEEFKNEVRLIAKLQHKNLVRLLGFCLDGHERLLIYEFMLNGSLDQFIFDPSKRVNINWETLYNIIRGIARGISYLHEESRLKIIHRDLKASNILLGANMNPKISDFGIARIVMMDQAQASTNKIVGTYGYMAPEYAMHGHFSVKSDIFSYGVLVLEILSGRKINSLYEANGVHDLLSYAWKQWMEGTALELLDPNLKENCSIHEVMRCIHIGLLCVQRDIDDRPTMESVIHELNNGTITLPLPSSPPAFFVQTRTQPIMSPMEGTETQVPLIA